MAKETLPRLLKKAGLSHIAPTLQRARLDLPTLRSMTAAAVGNALGKAVSRDDLLALKTALCPARSEARPAHSSDGGDSSGGEWLIVDSNGQEIDVAAHDGEEDLQLEENDLQLEDNGMDEEDGPLLEENPADGDEDDELQLEENDEAGDDDDDLMLEDNDDGEETGGGELCLELNEDEDEDDDEGLQLEVNVSPARGGGHTESHSDDADGLVLEDSEGAPVSCGEGSPTGSPTAKKPKKKKLKKKKVAAAAAAS